jgi:hypothetical protein
MELRMCAMTPYIDSAYATAFNLIQSLRLKKKQKAQRVDEPFLVPIEECYTLGPKESQGWGARGNKMKGHLDLCTAPHVMIAVQTNRKLPGGKHDK